MKWPLFLFCLGWLVISFSNEHARAGDGVVVTESIDLLKNGGLKNWIWFTQDEKTKRKDVWKLRDGVLSCKGTPAGYLQTRRWYRDYILELDWRWPKGGGNNGVLVHASAPFVLGVWPRSLEIQLGSGDAGDFWVIGETVDVEVENRDARRSDRRTLNLTDGSEKPLGEWNHMKIICHRDDVKVFVNGDLVNHGTQCTIEEGAIALQSEGTPIEYRNIVIKPLAN